MNFLCPVDRLERIVEKQKITSENADALKEQMSIHKSLNQLLCQLLVNI